MLSARVICDDGTYGPDFDHMTLLVNGQWIADVGFGESSMVPLDIDGTPQGNYRVLDGQYQVLRGGEWKTDYFFSLTPRELEEFGPMCEYQQTSPQSAFTKKKVITLARDDGRITLTADKLIVTKNGLRRETAIEDWEKALVETFAIRPVVVPG
jgi:N-hydroxyarylamine O-acetyltransferase